MDFKVFIKGAALVTGLTGMIFAGYLPGGFTGGTTQTWVDHKPAPGCKYVAKTPAGPEIAFYHLGAAFGPGPGVTFVGPVGGPNAKMTLDNNVQPYYLDKDLVVPPTCTLVVKPGNWIYGGAYSKLDTNTATVQNSCSYGSSIIILEGAIGHFVGTKDSTIVMTGYGDDFRDLASFGPGIKGSWGGLILKGRAPVANAGWHGTYPTMEGIAQYEPTSMQYFGQHDSFPNDCSGQYEYLSVRHGGAGRETNSEINGISLYGVGNGTTFDHIEVMSNFDDAIEYFGGTIDMKYICNSFCDDDQFDIDNSYCGRMQFCLCCELNWMGNRCGEWDQLKHYDDPVHTKGPTISNMTLIGCGKYTANIVDTGSNGIVNDINGGFFPATEDQNYGARYIWQLADSMKGDFRNMLGIDQAKYAFWMRNHDLLPALGPTGNNPGQAPLGAYDSVNHVFQGPAFYGTMVYHTDYRNCNDNAEVWDSLVQDDNGQGRLSVNWLKNPANKCFCNVDPQLRGVSREFKFAALDPRPCVTSPCLNPAYWVKPINDGWFDTTATYVGAFNANDLWCNGWTKLSQMGCLSGDLSTFPENGIVPSVANFDIAYTINDPAVYPTNATVMLDGYDITSTVLPIFIANNGSLACGGTWIKIPSVPASALASIPANCTPNQQYNYFGLHTLQSTFNLSDGRVLTGTSRFKIAN